MNGSEQFPRGKDARIRRCPSGLAIVLMWQVLTTWTAWSQSRPSSAGIDRKALPEFEVAAIKPATGVSRSDDFSHGNVIIRNELLTTVLCTAFDVSLMQVETPDWMNRTRFDIFAKSEKPVPEKEVKRMLQNLLKLRFKMTMHHETKDFVVEVMTVAKGGPKFTPADSEGPVHGNNVNGHFIRKRMSMGDLARSLCGGGPAIDRTGLAGRYDIDMNYGKYEDPSNTYEMGRILSAIRAALEPELGLKLQWKKVALDVIIVDHAERIPADN